MKNIEQWKPSKYIVKKGKLRITKNPRELGIASRLSASVVVEAYNRNFLEHCSGRLLDLGCGKVPFYEFYKEHAEEVYCVDWSNSAHGAKHLDITCDLAGEIPLPDGRFETIVLSSVLEHLPEPLILWGEMARLLTSKGKAVINVPFMYWLHEVPHDYYRYTEYALRRMADQSGFNVLLMEPLGGAPMVIGDIAAKVLIRVPWIGRMLAVSVQACCNLLLSIPTTKRAVKKTAKLFPSSYFMVVQKK